MTLEQALELQAIAGQLVDVAIEESNPAHWPGAGKKPNKWTKTERGNRLWGKKNAAATMNLLLDISRLLGVERGAEPGVGFDDAASNDRLIEEAGREVDEIMKEVRVKYPDVYRERQRDTDA